MDDEARRRATKPMVGLFSMLSDDKKNAALAFSGNHNLGADEHRLKESARPDLAGRAACSLTRMVGPGDKGVAK